jgi:MFS family permease
VLSFFANGIFQWLPSFFVRSFHLSTGEVGTWLTVIYGGGGVIGTILGGELATRYAAGKEAKQLRAMALIFVLCGLTSAAAYWQTNLYASLGLFALSTLGSNLTTGPLLATIQTLVPDRMRALSISFIYLSANLVGLGLGPLAAGFLSDTLHAAWGEESLRYALVVLCPGYAWAALHLIFASRTAAADIDALAADSCCTVANAQTARVAA